jgi:FkbM family methyltransferase
MSWFQVAKHLYRSHAYMYPGIFSFQQREMPALRSQLNIVHEPDFQALSILQFPDAPLVVDIGANIGQSIGSIRAVLGGACIKAFEPNPDAFEKLCKIYGYDENIDLFSCALGREIGTIDLSIPVCGGISFHQLANITDTNENAIADFLIREGFTWAKHDSVTFQKVEVELRMLDCFDFEPDVIKIDAEGSEFDVIQGGLSTIEKFKPVLLVESGERPEIVSILRDRGYDRYLYREGVLIPAGSSASLNSIFLTPDHLNHADF